MPWDRDRLSPEQLRELWLGWVWRRSRDLEVTATVLLTYLRSQGAKTEFVDVIEWMPGYDGEYIRMMREKHNWPPPDDMR